jgi:hypothetical protein
MRRGTRSGRRAISSGPVPFNLLLSWTVQGLRWATSSIKPPVPRHRRPTGRHYAATQEVRLGRQEGSLLPALGRRGEKPAASARILRPSAGRRRRLYPLVCITFAMQQSCRRTQLSIHAVTDIKIDHKHSSASSRNGAFHQVAGPGPQLKRKPRSSIVSSSSGN